MQIPLAREVVGREEEVDTVAAFLADTFRGATAAVIGGEPGIGKTTLWRAAAEMAEERSFQVLACRPSAAETTYSFAGLGDLLGGVLDEVLDALPSPQQRALQVALLLKEANGPPPHERVIALGVLTLLRALASRGAVLVAVDDAQWLDQSSAQALEFAARRLANEQIAVLLTVRREPGGIELPLERALADRLTHVPLAGLSMGALHRIVVARFGRALSRPTLRRVHDVTRGNPFHALEIARMLVESQVRLEPGEELPLPAGLEALLRARLERLPRAVRRLLEAASLLAEPTVELLERLEARSQQVGDQLDLAAAAGVIELDGERIRFTHPLLAAAAAAGIDPRRLHSLHIQLAALVGDRERRARHLALGTTRADSGVADAIEAGAQEAARRGAAAAAADLLERAAQLTPPSFPTQAWRRKIEAARTNAAAGLLPRARQSLEAMLAEAPAGCQRADVLIALAGICDNAEGALALLADALRETAGDAERTYEVHRVAAMTEVVRTGPVAALEHAEAALEAAKRTAEPRLEIPALALLSAFEIFAGRVTPGLLEHALELERQADLGLQYVDSPRLMFHAHRLLLSDRLDQARPVLEAEAAALAAQGNDYGYSDLLGTLAALECRAGNFLLAADHVAEACVLHEQAGMGQGAASALARKALVAAHLGRVDEARAAARRGLELATENGDHLFRILNLAASGFLELSLGNIAEADRLLRPLPLWLVAHGWNETSLTTTWPNAIEALIGVGERDRAREYLAMYDERARRADCPWALATAGRSLALLLATEGDLDGALGASERALREHARAPSPFERGRTLLVLGTVQRRARQRGAARESVESARTIFEDAGARLWAEKARAELKRIGGRRAGPAELTETEERVAKLVSDGKSNKEVAAELFITVRTVEWNLSKIYTKLGLRSRTELTRAFARQTSGNAELP